MIEHLAPPHTAAKTPESLRSRLGRSGDRDAPWGVPCTIALLALPHTAAETPESLRSCLGRSGDRDAPLGGIGYDRTSSSSPHSGTDT